MQIYIFYNDDLTESFMPFQTAEVSYCELWNMLGEKKKKPFSPSSLHSLPSDWDYNNHEITKWLFNL